MAKKMKIQTPALNLDFCLNSGLETINNAAETLERAANEIRRYAQRYAASSAEPDSISRISRKPEDVLSWVVNYIPGNILVNCRLDLMISRAAEIAQARAELRIATKKPAAAPQPPQKLTPEERKAEAQARRDSERRNHRYEGRRRWKQYVKEQARVNRDS